MKKNITLIIVFISILSYAQIGMGRVNPRGALDINKDDATNTMGLVLPTNSDVNNMINPLGGSVVPGTIMYDSTNNCVRLYRGTNTWSNCFCEGISIGIIESLNCDGATHIGTLASNKAASGVSSIISYTGGNGGLYDAQSITSTGVSGLTATLDPGSFANGSGTLTYIITGTALTAGTASFTINIGGQTCILTRNVTEGLPPDISNPSINCIGWKFSGFGTLSGNVNGFPVSATVSLLTGAINTSYSPIIKVCNATQDYTMLNPYSFDLNTYSSSSMRIKFNRKVSNVKLNLSSLLTTATVIITFKRDGTIISNPTVTSNACSTVYNSSNKTISSFINVSPKADIYNFGGQWFDEIEVTARKTTTLPHVSPLLEFCIGAAK